CRRTDAALGRGGVLPAPGVRRHGLVAVQDYAGLAGGPALAQPASGRGYRATAGHAAASCPLQRDRQLTLCPVVSFSRRQSPVDPGETPWTGRSSFTIRALAPWSSATH